MTSSQSKTSGVTLSQPKLSLKALEPMYASVGSEVPGESWTFEPKYDGIRVLAYATPTQVKLITRNGEDKAQQFPKSSRRSRSWRLRPDDHSCSTARSSR